MIQVYEKRRLFTQSDFDRFAALTGDDNPIHVDPEFSVRTKFGRTVAHGMFLYSHLCAALNEMMPGMVQLEQEMLFPNPTYAEDAVTLTLKWVETDADGVKVLETAVTRSDGCAGLQGKTWVVSESPAAKREKVGEGRVFAADDQGLNYKGLQVGQHASDSRTFTTDDVVEYISLVGDENPRYAQGSGLVPGGLLGGMFSDLLGTRLPGRGTNWLKQRLIFPKAAKVGEAITAVVVITRIRPEKALVNLRTTCTNSTGDLVCSGESLVLINDVE